MKSRKIFIILGVLVIIILIAVAFTSYKTSAQWDQDYGIRDDSREYKRDEERNREAWQHPEEISEDYE